MAYPFLRKIGVFINARIRRLHSPSPRFSYSSVFKDPAFKPAVLKARGYWEYINYGGVEECGTYVKDILEIGSRFKSLLSGKT